MKKETWHKYGAYHDKLILLLEKVVGHKNRKRILEKIAILEIILIHNQPIESEIITNELLNEQ